MNVEQLIEQYGYAAILIGTFFEGETILVIGGFLAHQGYLGIEGTIGAGFAGAMLGDQLYFYIGRLKGSAFIDKRENLKRHREKVERLLQLHQVWLILGFRFLYGMRTVTPFILGMSRVNPVLFLVLNTIGAFIWALAIGLAGYYFGSALESLLGRLKDYELLVVGSFAAIALALWFYRKWHGKQGIRH